MDGASANPTPLPGLICPLSCPPLTQKNPLPAFLPPSTWPWAVGPGCSVVRLAHVIGPAPLEHNHKYSISATLWASASTAALAQMEDSVSLWISVTTEIMPSYTTWHKIGSFDILITALPIVYVGRTAWNSSFISHFCKLDLWHPFTQLTNVTF